MNNTRLFVGNLPPDTSEEQIKEVFGFYGICKNVDLKTKKSKLEDEAPEVFAFVNIEIEDHMVDQCINEFSQQKFNGSWLNVSRAKESFLERLKREREEANAPKEVVKEPELRKFEYKKIQPLPKMESRKTFDSEESSSEEEVEIVAPILPAYIAKKNYTNGHSEIKDKAKLADMKRMEGLDKLKNAMDEQKKAIKSALLSIDTLRSNKIIFEPPEGYEPIVQKKAQLFNDDEEDEGMPESTFDVKQTFAGESGEKLFKLQAKFQNDKRFAVDEKFLEDDKKTKVRINKQLKREQEHKERERKQVRKELKNWDQDSGNEEDLSMEEEKKRQLAILGSVTGQLIAERGERKVHKGMLRYDPSKKEHLKYLELANESEPEGEMETEPLQAEQPFEVGKEKFYNVADDLKNTIGNKSEAKPFSIFDMLGISHNEEVGDEKYQEKSIIAPLANQAKFHYDSSDTDDDAEDKKAVIKKATDTTANQAPLKGGKYSKTGVWRQNFFIRADDERLKEAFAFVKREEVTAEEFGAKRLKLKSLIKQKVRKARSDQRKNESFSKKRKTPRS